MPIFSFDIFLLSVKRKDVKYVGETETPAILPRKVVFVVTNLRA